MSWYDDKPWMVLHSETARRAGTASPRTALEMFADAVAAAPERPALTSFGAPLTYRQVDELSTGVAAYLLERGFRKGDRLGLYLQNTPHFVLALLGAWKAGGVVVPLNPMYRQELDHMLRDAGVTALVSGEGPWAEHVGATATAAGVRIALTVRESDTAAANGRDRGAVPAGEGADEGVEDLLEAARSRTGANVADPGTVPDDIGLISYTSGTSGTPKGATNTHRNLTVNAAMHRLYLGVPTGSTVLAMAPLFHITGMVCQLLAAIDLTGTLALSGRFEPGVMLETLRRERPAYMVGPSTAFIALMSHPDFEADAFSSLRVIHSGGAPLPEAVVSRFRDLTGRPILNGYGLTECTAPCINVPPGREAPVDPDSGTVSIGLPMPSVGARIVGENGEDLPPGSIGEIAVEGPMVVPGYWNRPDATAEALPGGRLLTGDVGFMDGEGWFYVVDRKKDMINASGFKVWPREVEDVLYTHPGVQEAAVVGEPDAYRGETVAAYVSLRPGHTATAEDLVGHCRARLAAYKAPRRVELLTELPKTTSGKILRRALRHAAAG
ncbi:AMP-binding protein [Streptomyces sp. NPDC002896]|uniref:AMP-binding protein n=1 Tax=Streptomyces sp. NPDC002896 TaxID=3154438 RepID=UPI0033200B73